MSDETKPNWFNTDQFTNKDSFIKNAYNQAGFGDTSLENVLPSAGANNAWWNILGQGDGVLGSGISFDNISTGAKVAGGLFDAWSTYQNKKDMLKLAQEQYAYKNANTQANTELLQNRLQTLQYNNAHNGNAPITGNSLNFANVPQQVPVQQAANQQQQHPVFSQWKKA